MRDGGIKRGQRESRLIEMDTFTFIILLDLAQILLFVFIIFLSAKKMIKNSTLTRKYLFDHNSV